MIYKRYFCAKLETRDLVLADTELFVRFPPSSKSVIPSGNIPSNPVAIFLPNAQPKLNISTIIKLFKYYQNIINSDINLIFKRRRVFLQTPDFVVVSRSNL